MRFGADEHALVYEKPQLDRTRTSVNPGLSMALEQHATRLLAELPSPATFEVRVREQIVASLGSGSTSATQIAERLRLSERTLRRRLRESGVAFSDLLAEVRRDLAARYLGDPSLSITEVGLLLGFSDTSSFQRAFRRWYGVPPSEYRRGRGS